MFLSTDRRRMAPIVCAPWQAGPRPSTSVQSLAEEQLVLMPREEVAGERLIAGQRVEP